MMMEPISNQFDGVREANAINIAKQKIDAASDFQKMLKTEQKKEHHSTDDKLMDVCYEFESIMVNQMFKVMRKTLHKENSMLYGGHAESIFDDMLYDQYSSITAKTAQFGLAKQIYDQISESKTEKLD